MEIINSMAISTSGTNFVGGPSPRPVSFTEEQKSTLSEILAQYDSEDLSEEDAKSIVETFQKAGIRPGEELKNLLKEAGYSAQELANLAGIEGGQQNRPPPPPSYLEQGVNQESLQQLQSILEHFSDLSNLSSEEEEKLNQLLSESGLLEPGALVNTKT